MPLPHHSHPSSSPTAQQRCSGSLRTVSCLTPEALHKSEALNNGAKPCSNSPKYDHVSTPPGCSRAPPAPTRASSMLSNRTANLTSLLQQITRCGEALQQAQQVQSCGEWISAGPTETLAGSQLHSQPLQSRRPLVSSGGGADLAPATGTGWNSLKVVPIELSSHQLMLQDVFRQLQEGARQQQALLRQLQVHRSVMQVKEEELETHRRCLEEWKQQQQLLFQQERKELTQQQQKIIHLRASVEALNDKAAATQDEFQSQKQRQREQYQLLVEHQQLLQTHAAEVVALASGCEASFKETDERAHQQRQQIESVQQAQQKISQQIGELLQDMRALKLEHQSTAKKMEDQQAQLHELQIVQHRLTQQFDSMGKRVEEEASARRRDGIQLEQVLQQQQRCLPAEALLEKAADNWQRRLEEAEVVLLSKIQHILQQRDSDSARHRMEERQQLQQEHQQALRELRDTVTHLQLRAEKVEMLQEEQHLLLQQRQATVEDIRSTVSEVQRSFTQLAHTQRTAAERVQQQQRIHKEVEELQKGYNKLLSMVAGCCTSENMTLLKALEKDVRKDKEGVTESAAGSQLTPLEKKTAETVRAGVTAPTKLLSARSIKSPDASFMTETGLTTDSNPCSNSKNSKAAACDPQPLHVEKLSVCQSSVITDSSKPLQRGVQVYHHEKQQQQYVHSACQRKMDGGDCEALTVGPPHGFAGSDGAAAVAAAARGLAADSPTTAETASETSTFLKEKTAAAADSSRCSTRLSTGFVEGADTRQQMQEFQVQQQQQPQHTKPEGQQQQQHQQLQSTGGVSSKIQAQPQLKREASQVQQVPHATMSSLGSDTTTAASVVKTRATAPPNRSVELRSAEAKLRSCFKESSLSSNRSPSSSRNGISCFNKSQAAADLVSSNSNISKQHPSTSSSCYSSTHIKSQLPATYTDKAAAAPCATQLCPHNERRNDVFAFLTRNSESAYSSSSHESTDKSTHECSMTGSSSSAKSSSSSSSNTSRAGTPHGKSNTQISIPLRDAAKVVPQRHTRNSGRTKRGDEQGEEAEKSKANYQNADKEGPTAEKPPRESKADMPALSPRRSWSGDHDIDKDTTPLRGAESAAEKMEWRIDNFHEVRKPMCVFPEAVRQKHRDAKRKQAARAHEQQQLITGSS